MYDKSVENHLDTSIRVTVPDCFDRIGYFEAADALRNLAPIRSRGHVAHAIQVLQGTQKSLQKIVRAVHVVQHVESDPSILEEFEVWKDCVEDASWALWAALTSARQMLDDGDTSLS